MEKFRGKIFNSNVFEKYMKTLESTHKNGLINSSIFQTVNKYKSKMSEQAGGYFITEPIKGRIGGKAQNYDGETDIQSNSRDTFYQTKIAVGRCNAWGEDDFVSELTGTNFKAEAGEIKEYWDEVKQGLVLSMLKGIFGMTGNNDFALKHTYEVAGNLDADSCNKASQKALGDKKADLGVMVTSSAVSTNLEGLNLINFLKYTDKDGIEKELTIGQYNGKLLIVDDDMPTEVKATTYKASQDTEVQAGKTYYTRSGSSSKYVYTPVVKPTGNPSTSSYYEVDVAGETVYTSYMFSNGFFEFEDVGVETPFETERDAKTKGGHTDLISRVRWVIVPKYISYKSKASKSPLDTDLENGSNWEVANNGELEGTVYVNDKLIPLVRIISRG